MNVLSINKKIVGQLNNKLSIYTSLGGRGIYIVSASNMTEEYTNSKWGFYVTGYTKQIIHHIYELGGVSHKGFYFFPYDPYKKLFDLIERKGTLNNGQALNFLTNHYKQRG